MNGDEAPLPLKTYFVNRPQVDIEPLVIVEKEDIE